MKELRRKREEIYFFLRFCFGGEGGLWRKLNFTWKFWFSWNWTWFLGLMVFNFSNCQHFKPSNVRCDDNAPPKMTFWWKTTISSSLFSLTWVPNFWTWISTAKHWNLDSNPQNRMRKKAIESPQSRIEQPMSMSIHYHILTSKLQTTFQFSLSAMCVCMCVCGCVRQLTRDNRSKQVKK